MSITRSSPRSMLLAGVLATGLLSASGCSAGVTNASGTPTNSASRPATSLAAAPTSTQTQAETGSGGPSGSNASLPEEFPLPPGTTVDMVSDDGQEIAATLTVTDGTAAVTFWESALPSAGYEVTSSQSVGPLSEIRFTGHGCVGNSQLAITGTSVAVQCDLS